MNAGRAVAFYALASAEGPIAYQWMKDLAPLTTQTAPTLALPAVAAADAGSYQCSASNAGGATLSEPALLSVFDPPLANAAAFLGATAPAQMEPGQELLIGIQMRDTSPLTWSAAQGYRLAALDDPDGLLQGASRVDLPDANEVIPVGGAAQFIALARAPAQPGSYSAHLRMVEEGVEFFGETATLAISVVPPRNGAGDWALYE